MLLHHSPALLNTLNGLFTRKGAPLVFIQIWPLWLAIRRLFVAELQCCSSSTPKAIRRLIIAHNLKRFTFAPAKSIRLLIYDFLSFCAVSKTRSATSCCRHTKRIVSSWHHACRTGGTTDKQHAKKQSTVFLHIVPQVS